MPVTNIPKLRMIGKEKSTYTLGSFLTSIPALMRINALGKQSVGAYIQQFKHPLIRTLLSQIAWDAYAATALACSISGFTSGDAGYVEGGSLKMAMNMANRFIEAGGKIQYGKKVEKVVLKNSKVTGVSVDGAYIPADAVILATDTLFAIDHLFETPIDEPWAVAMRENTKPANCTFISLGIETNLSEILEALAFHLEKPVDFANRQVSSLTFYNYADYQGYAPAGCTAMTTVLEGDYDYWKSARENGSYIKMKQHLADQVISRLEEKLPQTKGKVVVWDIATPLTYERYCGTYQGSWMTILQAGQKMVTYPCKPKKIDRLYFAGQRLVPPGGMPGALVTGRRSAQYLCRDNDIVFRGAL